MPIGNAHRLTVASLRLMGGRPKASCVLTSGCVRVIHGHALRAACSQGGSQCFMYISLGLCVHLRIYGRLLWGDWNAVGGRCGERRGSYRNRKSRSCDSIFLPKVKVSLPVCMRNSRGTPPRVPRLKAGLGLGLQWNSVLCQPLVCSLSLPLQLVTCSGMLVSAWPAELTGIPGDGLPRPRGPRGALTLKQLLCPESLHGPLPSSVSLGCYESVKTQKTSLLLQPADVRRPVQKEREGAAHIRAPASRGWCGAW